ncbi:MAG: YgaP-like transmembrane domain [Micavibrio sp.]
MKTISAQQFSTIIAQGEAVNILDVRTGVERATACLDQNFIHIPLHRLDARRFMDNYGHSLAAGPLYILCRSGSRAEKAAHILSGLTETVIVEGGLDACSACGVALEHGAALSLERQVRITAGALVLSGLSLGAFINPVFYLLSAFIGAGLVFSGITDWCGMALLLARAPWNNKKGENHD